jgi:hypothetical protein
MQIAWSSGRRNIMKIRTMLGLAAVGGLLYAHRKNGGEWTFDSLRDSVRQLSRAIQRNVKRAQREAEDTLREGARQVDRAAQRAEDYTGNGRR